MKMKISCIRPVAVHDQGKRMSHMHDCIRPEKKFISCHEHENEFDWDINECIKFVVQKKVYQKMCLLKLNLSLKCRFLRKIKNKLKNLAKI